MDAVVVEREADEQAVQIEFALERADDRDRTATADQRRWLLPFDLQRPAGNPQRLVFDRQRNGGAALVADEFSLDVRRQARRHEGAEGFGDPVRVLLADKPAGDLGAGLGRQDGLRALAGVASDDPVNLASRPRPKTFQRRAVTLARRRRQPDVTQERRRVEVEFVPLVGNFLRKLFDPVVEAGDGDSAGVVMQFAEDLRQHVDRVDG